MRVLFDTHILIWAASDSPRLPVAARRMLAPGSGVARMFSAISVLEVAVKSALGRDAFRFDARPLRLGLLANGYEELPVTGLHAQVVAKLPILHGDPFDRLLVAQSVAEQMPLATADHRLAEYPADIRLLA